MTFSEFSESLDNQNIIEKLKPLLHVLENLDINETPILWIRLSCVAALCGSLISELGVQAGFKNKQLDLESLLRNSNDEYLNKRVDKYISHFEQTMNEGL